MGIDKASCDYWITGKNNGEMIENPTWKDIEKMILSLDGWNRTLVTFGNYDEGYYMVVGGGKNETYIAYASYDDEEKIYNLMNQTGSEKELVELVVGGQRGNFPEKNCVSLGMVLSAAKKFFETQETDQNMKWEE